MRTVFVTTCFACLGKKGKEAVSPVPTEMTYPSGPKRGQKVEHLVFQNCLECAGAGKVIVEVLGPYLERVAPWVPA